MILGEDSTGAGYAAKKTRLLFMNSYLALEALLRIRLMAFPPQLHRAILESQFQ